MPNQHNDNQDFTQQLLGYGIAVLGAVVFVLWGGATVACFLSGNGALDTHGAKASPRSSTFRAAWATPPKRGPSPPAPSSPARGSTGFSTIVVLVAAGAAGVGVWRMFRGMGGDTLARRKRLGVQTQARYAREATSARCA